MEVYYSLVFGLEEWLEVNLEKLFINLSYGDANTKWPSKGVSLNHLFLKYFHKGWKSVQQKFDYLLTGIT